MADDTRVDNAGLVLLGSYLPMLFARAGLLDDGRLRDDAAAHAVGLLGYVGGGGPSILNAILCGLPVDAALADVALGDADRALCDGLLAAAIGAWSAIGDSSIDGFRSNWLARPGLLARAEEGWRLRVERRAYDVLLDRAPWSFAIVRLPWMDGAVHVAWR